MGKRTTPTTTTWTHTDPATCWQWDHTCYAKRLRGLRSRAKARKATPAARIGGRIVPNTTLTA